MPICCGGDIGHPLLPVCDSLRVIADPNCSKSKAMLVFSKSYCNGKWKCKATMYQLYLKLFREPSGGTNGDDDHDDGDVEE